MIEETHIQAAIIGMYRSGADFNTIAKELSLKLEYVVQVVQDYLKTQSDDPAKYLSKFRAMVNQTSLFDVMDRQVKTFFNTIHLSGPELASAKAQNSLQDVRILAIFREGGKLTPLEAHRAYCGLFPECPCTSIRRSITVLTGKGLLIKTEEMKVESFGKPNYLWKIV